MVTSGWNRMFESVLLTLEADTELCGDPSRDALTEGPGTRSLSETQCKEQTVDGSNTATFRSNVQCVGNRDCIS